VLHSSTATAMCWPSRSIVASFPKPSTRPVRCAHTATHLCTAILQPLFGPASHPTTHARITTFWSMAPKIDLPSAPDISILTWSPSFMKVVVGLPSAMVSIMRISAMQL
jgi:hypothetical protein